EGPPDPSKPPYVSDVGSRYVPETLFDRDALYVRAKPGSRFDGDYWSPKNWLRVQPRRMFDSLVKNDNKPAFTKAEAARAQQPLMTATQTADTGAALESKMGHLVKLRAVPSGTAFWTSPVVVPSVRK
ncbi:MAG: Transglutaminase-like superfamily protein, partial [Verrucomicrobiaceae bacterium]|nr:Transglutaminase-like superfamily protein [Verrucomicrobiaceae bacterium]